MKKARISKNTLLLLAMVIATMIMGIGYASIESVTGEIEGKVIADAQSGIFITDVEYMSDVDANTTNCEINNFLGTMLNSTIDLSKTNPNSEIKYKIMVYNSSAETVPFVGVVYDNDFYDNQDITFEITQEGFQIGQTIEPNETKEVYITFKYKNATTEMVPENTVLKSYLNFKMAEPNRMVVAKPVDETTNYLTSSIPKNQIESIKFEQGKEPEYSDKIIARFDASEKQDESIIGYYTDVDNNDLYELTFVSQEIIYANKDARYLFASLTNVNNIEFYNFSTKNVTNMESMFVNCKNLRKLDLSSFDTSKNTSMYSMFSGCGQIKELNIDSFDTSNVNTMQFAFYNCYSLLELDLSKFKTNQVTNMQYMFFCCASIKNLDLSSFDTSRVTTMGSMFAYDSGLETLDISQFDISHIKSMTDMFRGCRSLIKLDVENWNTSNVRDMINLFKECTNIEELNLEKWDTSNVENMTRMFQACTKLNKIYVSEFDEETQKGWTTSKLTASANMFEGCYKIRGGNGTVYNGAYQDATYARIDTAEAPGYFTNIKDKPADAEMQ